MEASLREQLQTETASAAEQLRTTQVSCCCCYDCCYLCADVCAGTHIVRRWQDYIVKLYTHTLSRARSI